MNFHDNFELLMWFKKFVINSNSNLSDYKAIERRDAIPSFPPIKKPKKIDLPKHDVKVKETSKLETRTFKAPPEIPEPKFDTKKSNIRAVERT